MRRSWGLRTRVLVAAAVTAAVALVTFGILLEGLLDQRSAATQARATSEAILAASDLQGLIQDIERGEAVSARLTAAQRRLARTETDPVQSRQVRAINTALTAYAARPDDVSYDAVRRQLSRYLAAEQAELLERRARSATLRDRSLYTAAAGLVVLLVL